MYVMRPLPVSRVWTMVNQSGSMTHIHSIPGERLDSGEEATPLERRDNPPCSGDTRTHFQKGVRMAPRAPSAAAQPHDPPDMALNHHPGAQVRNHPAATAGKTHDDHV